MRRMHALRVSRIVFAVEIAVVVVLAALTAHLFFGSYAMQEGSMEPAIQTGDRYLVNRAAYALTGVHRGDLIAYKSKDEADSTIHVKRVIGLPGETVQIKNGLILIDGKTYMEDRELPAITNGGAVEQQPLTIGDDEYFVLGDNRNNSEDSRFADVGNIMRANIIGKAWYLSSPRSRSGFLK